tara:strand:+ start:2189 stop:2323 length:135 start_codon:yes stop_codon:yes gene_type:complete
MGEVAVQVLGHSALGLGALVLAWYIIKDLVSLLQKCEIVIRRKP